jgi:hypothetical protein
MKPPLSKARAIGGLSQKVVQCVSKKEQLARPTNYGQGECHASTYITHKITNKKGE